MSKLSYIYPCDDLPYACGWAKDNMVNGHLTYLCEYPNCWCSRWFVSPDLNNKLLKIGDKFHIVIYRGTSDYISYRVWRYIKKLKKSNIYINIVNANFRAQILGVDFVEGPEYKQVDLKGEIVRWILN